MDWVNKTEMNWVNKNRNELKLTKQKMHSVNKTGNALS